MKSLRFADLSLVVKMALAPAFAVVVLALVSGGAFLSQQAQTAAIDRIVQNEMKVSLRLANVSERITAAHLKIYQLLTNQAGGLEVAVTDDLAALTGEAEVTEDLAAPTAEVDATADLAALTAEVDAIAAELAALRADLPESEQARLAELTKDLADYRGGIEVVGSMMGIDFATAVSFVQPFEEHYVRMTRNLDEASSAVQAAADQRAKDSAARAALMGKITAAGSLATMLAVALLSLFIILGVRRGIRAIADATETLAAGDHDIDVQSLQRGDELGSIVKGLGVFKENQARLAAMRQQQEAMQAREQAMREEVEAERAATQEAQAAVVRELAGGLSRLSHGDLTHRLDQPFTAEYEQLRADFNAAVEKLQDAMGIIAANASQIGAGADEIAGASDNLSRRTEQQAASLEETAAALDQITATVRKSAEGAKTARQAVQTAKSGAAEGGDVVRQAVTAMGEIEKSSQQISQIIGVIDEIAFQTNLLALNAGVEAARAGDAGRGFAVVASEVRALAQRSADAAKEIKALISSSTQQVGAGVDLVGRTGKALTQITAQVDQIDGLVSEIAASSQEQALGLADVNSAVNQMDQVTQQNAAMVEESTAATHALRNEAAELRRLIGEFKTGAPAGKAAALGARPAPAGQDARPAPSAPRQMAARLQKSFGNTAVKAAEWEEF